MSKTTPCFEPKCNEYKQKYDQCFNKWYSEVFLSTSSNKSTTNSQSNVGSTNKNEKICEFEWNKYHTCLMNSLNNSNNSALKASIEKTQKEIEAHPPFFENESSPDTSK
ncbi:hypothetical protein ACO0QE_001979 [Hanseniaspora vineae]